MTDTPPTRSALLDTKERRQLAEKGHTLLEKKRDALIHEFFQTIDEYKAHKKTVYDNLQDAYDDLHTIQATNGVDIIRSMGQSQPPSITVETGTKNIMGVTIPTHNTTTQKPVKNASFLDTDLAVHETRTTFTEITEQLITLHELEATIHRLAEAIKRAKRRVNSLEHIQIPSLEATESRIEQHLEEKERQRFVRLKQLK
jgi:V/A-type H+-transporting ATPase subunit D